MYKELEIEIEITLPNNGAMTKECQIFKDTGQETFSETRQNCKIMSLIITKISFSLSHSMSLCVRGSQTVFKSNILIGRFVKFTQFEI